MAQTTIASQRLNHLQLAQPKFETPAEVVAWLGAVQSQEYDYAKWALGLRYVGATDAGVEQAITDGSILRTHVMRPTWHYVTPEDIRWMLKLTGERVKAAIGYYVRQLELDEALIQRSKQVFIRALEGKQHRTRLELGEALAQAGIVAGGQRMAHLVFYAELDGLLCSGPRKGKQISYMLLDERAPNGRSLEREEALAELARRYFTSHGPALVHDFAWWSGLTVADAKNGLELAKADLVSDTFDSQTYWLAASAPARSEAPPRALLLPPFDEFTVGYKERSQILEPPAAEQDKEKILDGVIVIDCLVAGNWRRKVRRGVTEIELLPFRPFSAAEQEAISAAADRMGAFLGLPPSLV